MARRLPTAVLAPAFLLATLCALAIRSREGPRLPKSFEPHRMADLEVAMWQAYYGRQRLRLFALLVTALREQVRCSWARAIQAGFHLARAAAVFGVAQSDYERILPDLERAYTIAKDWTGAQFDPAAVSRAELAWWVARRSPRQSDPDNVARLIAEEYALLCETSPASVHRAGLLRAQAGALHAAGGPTADWSEIDRLLCESYRALRAALDSARDRTAKPRGRHS